MLALDVFAQEIADKLTALGVDATVDARDLALPGAWVTLQSLSFEYLAGANVYTAVWAIFLIARDTGTPTALSELSDLVSAIANPVSVGDVQATTVVLPN